MSWFRERNERDHAPSESALPARRRRLLLWSMLLVIPAGVFAVGTGVNVGLAWAVQQSYAAGDYQGAAAWARAAVSLNPFDRYTPPYNLGTAYAAGDLLPEAVPELQTALDHAPNPEAACYPRANLALTYVRLGNRYYDQQRWPEAIDAYRAARALWSKQPGGDVCHDDPSFEEQAEQSSQEAAQGQEQAEEQQAQQPSPQPTPGDPTGQPTPGPSGTPSGEPTPGPTGTPSGEPTPGPSGEPTSQPTPGPGPEQPSSDALGDKLEQLIAQNEAADREREYGGPRQGKGRRPW